MKRAATSVFPSRDEVVTHEREFIGITPKVLEKDELRSYLPPVPEGHHVYTVRGSVCAPAGVIPFNVPYVRTERSSIAALARRRSAKNTEETRSDMTMASWEPISAVGTPTRPIFTATGISIFAF